MYVDGGIVRPFIIVFTKGIAEDLKAGVHGRSKMNICYITLRHYHW